MKKSISFFCSLIFILSAVLWMIDKNGMIFFQFSRLSAKFPLWFFVFGLGILYLLLMLLFVFVCENIQKQIVEKTATHAVKMKKNKVDEALFLLLKTMTSTTEGDMKSARKHLSALKNIIGSQILIDVLTLKILKGEKNFDAVEKLSDQLMKSKEGRLVGLKNLIETSSKRKDFEKALASANQAFETRQDLYWVVENTFRLRALSSDWKGALEVLETAYKKKLVSSEKYAQLKAVALYEIGLYAQKNGEHLVFSKYLTQAHNLYPSFVPAALDLAKCYEESGQIRKAEKLLKEVWRLNPTYDIAKAYLNLFKEDSPLNKVQKMETLALLNAHNQSLNNFLLAELDMKANLFDKARAEFEIFLVNNPATKKIAKMLAAYEKQVNKNQKAALNWEKRATTCEDDCVWVCADCGNTSTKWKPFCKKCGKINSFQWCLCKTEKN